MPCTHRAHRVEILRDDGACGIDPRPVVPGPLPATASAHHAFPRYALDGAAARRPAT
ncbi:hypothetical protein [Streptomyces sp. NPDC050564]|uniref:hypothetical protein n=1 Tax=Streptomyces sp. NPDC050564 TaxID=3365631 RepID=UPI0037A3EDD1